LPEKTALRRLGATATRVEKEQGGVALSVFVAGGEGSGATETVRGSHLLVATGRRPNTDDLGLQEAGVQTDQRGFIRVNNRLETSVPGVWAVGDVKGGPAFTHISFNDYQIVYANVVDGKALTTDNRPVLRRLHRPPAGPRRADGEGGAGDRATAQGRQDPNGLGRPCHRAR
jgi:pyruvate/2-oxoglutarate dehydrogenase complex dihydrolipoamide dehydrogenase (E3) component